MVSLILLCFKLFLKFEHYLKEFFENYFYVTFKIFKIMNQIDSIYIYTSRWYAFVNVAFSNA